MWEIDPDGERELRVLCAEEDDLSEGECIGVCDRELRRLSAKLREASRGAAMQLQLRWTAGPADDFDIAPQHALRMAGPERLHRGFLRREPSREVNRGIPPAHAVRNLRFREDATGESFAVTFDSRSDARDVGRVEAQSDDGHAPTA